MTPVIFSKNSVLAAAGAAVLAFSAPTLAVAQEDTSDLHVRTLTADVSEAASEALFDPSDAVLLLIDHQSGLFQTVKDVPVDELRRNTIVLTKIAKQAGIPIIYTASEPKGPNGPIIDELPPLLTDATFVPRQGEVSAWDNADFKAAVEATGRKTLLMAGVWTSVCLQLPALEANAEGYDVFAVMDASGDVSKLAADAALNRMASAGIHPVATNTVLSETHRTWNRPDAAEWGALYAELVPEYHALLESFVAAQDATEEMEAMVEEADQAAVSN